MLCFVRVRGVRGGVWVHACVGCGWSGRCAGVQARLVGKDQELWPHINTARSAAVGGAAWMARGAQYTLPSMHCNTTTCIPLHCLHSLWTTSSLDTAAPALQTRRHYRYRGLGAAAIGSAPGAAFFFTAYEKSKHRLEPILGM